MKRKSIAPTRIGQRYLLTDVTDQNVEDFAKRARRKTKRRVTVRNYEAGSPHWTIITYHYHQTGRYEVELLRKSLTDYVRVSSEQWLRGEAPIGRAGRFLLRHKPQDRGSYSVRVQEGKFYVGCQSFDLARAKQMLLRLKASEHIRVSRAGSERRRLVGDRRFVTYGQTNTYYSVSTPDLVRIGLKVIALHDEQTKATKAT